MRPATGPTVLRSPPRNHFRSSFFHHQSTNPQVFGGYKKLRQLLTFCILLCRKCKNPPNNVRNLTHSDFCLLRGVECVDKVQTAAPSIAGSITTLHRKPAHDRRRA